jgi:L-2,4-diaminobutyric acid acetyltransferase
MPDRDAMREKGPFRFRPPRQDDAPDLWQLVRDVGTLDRNSSYAYLLLCRDFADTCVMADREGTLSGFITGYRPPAQRDTVFVWQVGVASPARGQGLASSMLDALLLSEGCQGVQFLETTVTPSNVASRAMFQSLAQRLNTRLEESSGFEAECFPEASHEPERRLRIGPFDVSELSSMAD